MTATLAHSHGTPSGSPAERFTSRNPDDFPIPTTSQEDWRFSPLTKLREFFQPFESGGVIESDQSVPAGGHVEGVDPPTPPPFRRAPPPGDRGSAPALAN